MLETINPQLLFGGAGLVGAGIRGGIAYYIAKKETKKLKFDLAVYSDTLVKGIATGLVFSVGLPVTWPAVGVTALAATGVDTYLNKFNIKILPSLRSLLNRKKTTSKK